MKESSGYRLEKCLAEVCEERFVHKLKNKGFSNISTRFFGGAQLSKSVEHASLRTTCKQKRCTLTCLLHVSVQSTQSVMIFAAASSRARHDAAECIVLKPM